jgi:hypothetical protein
MSAMARLVDVVSGKVFRRWLLVIGLILIAVSSQTIIGGDKDDTYDKAKQDEEFKHRGLLILDYAVSSPLSYGVSASVKNDVSVVGCFKIMSVDSLMYTTISWTPINTAAPTIQPTTTALPVPTAPPTTIPSVGPTSSEPTEPPTVKPARVSTMSTIMSAAISVTSISMVSRPVLTSIVSPTGQPTPTSSVTPSTMTSVSQQFRSLVPLSLVPFSIQPLSVTLVSQLAGVSAPTAEPTVFALSTAMPTVVPTVSPTTVLTSGPTICPTVQPTLSPSEYSSPAPSLDPVEVSIGLSFQLVSAALPTIAPTTVVSYPFVSVYVSHLTSTMAPTVAPTWDPSSVPTDAPAAAPTAHPTLSPTLRPTTLPTYSPTYLVNGPTVAPTSSPTLSLVSQWRNELAFISSALPPITFLTGNKIALNYVDAIVNGADVSPIGGDSGCTRWNTFTSQLAIKQITYYPVSVTVAIYTTLAGSIGGTMNLTCSSTSASTEFVGFISDIVAASNVSAVIPQHVTCSTHSTHGVNVSANWTVGQCHGSPYMKVVYNTTGPSTVMLSPD